jgi:uncharacterized membrane protein
LRRRYRLATLAVIVLAWNAALFAAPAGEWPKASAATYLAGSLVCHQRPERSFHHDNAQFPVCARCLGLYVGAAAGVLAWLVVAGAGNTPRARVKPLLAPTFVRRALIVSALPTLITVALAWIGVWDASNALRAMLALPLGGVIAVIIAAVAARDLR